tara:strand:+ start:42 stop:356 length:315 start_codon:yes stop_codon:yes gene_type:complete
MVEEVSMAYEELIEKNPEAVVWDGFEDAYLGYSGIVPESENKAIAVYDYWTILDIVIEDMYEDLEEPIGEEEITYDAILYIEKNILSKNLGPYTPMVVYKEINA